VKKRAEETAKLNEKQKAMRVLQDVSEPSLTRAIEESLAAYRVSLAQRLPGGEVYDYPDFLWVTTGVPIDFYNGVFRCHLDPLRVDAQITEIMEEFRRRRLPMYWQVGPTSQPVDLRYRLLAHGFLHEEDEPGMALDLLAMNEDFSAPAGLDIRLVEDLSMLNEWIAVWLFAAPHAIPLEQGIHAQLGFGPDLPWRYYLGSVEGKPVATVLLVFGAGVAAVHLVVTLPEIRHRGIGTAMTLAALREARTIGYRIAILTASPYGEGIYRRIGFRAYGTISTYRWQASDMPSSEQDNT
jgi:GNAT superfamily N-acetyltransferase